MHKKLFYLAFILICCFCSCKNDSNFIDDKEKEVILNNYNEKYGLSVGEYISNDSDYPLTQYIKSEKDTLTNEWVSDSPQTHLEIKEINDSTINFTFRYFNFDKNEMKFKEGVASTACQDCDLELMNEGNTLFYNVKRYIYTDDTSQVVLRLDTIWKTKASARYYCK